jgi:hypothetical protein
LNRCNRLDKSIFDEACDTLEEFNGSGGWVVFEIDQVYSTITLVLLYNEYHTFSQCDQRGLTSRKGIMSRPVFSKRSALPKLERV